MPNRGEIISQCIAYTGTFLYSFCAAWQWIGQNHEELSSMGIIIGAIATVIGVISNVVLKWRIGSAIKKYGVDIIIKEKVI